MPKEPDEVFTIRLENGQDVEVSWYKDWIKLTSIGLAQDALELRGPISETGYEFRPVHKDFGSQIASDVLVDHAQMVAQSLWEAMKSKPKVKTSTRTQMALF